MEKESTPTNGQGLCSLLFSVVNEVSTSVRKREMYFVDLNGDNLIYIF